MAEILDIVSLTEVDKNVQYSSIPGCYSTLLSFCSTSSLGKLAEVKSTCLANGEVQDRQLKIYQTAAHVLRQFNNLICQEANICK